MCWSSGFPAVLTVPCSDMEVRKRSVGFLSGFSRGTLQKKSVLAVKALWKEAIHLFLFQVHLLELWYLMAESLKRKFLGRNPKVASAFTSFLFYKCKLPLQTLQIVDSDSFIWFSWSACLFIFAIEKDLVDADKFTIGSASNDHSKNPFV